MEAESAPGGKGPETLVTLLQVHKLLLLFFFKFLQVKSIPNRIAFTANAKRLVSFYHVTTHYFCLRVHY